MKLTLENPADKLNRHDRQMFNTDIEMHDYFCSAVSCYHFLCLIPINLCFVQVHISKKEYNLG